MTVQCVMCRKIRDNGQYRPAWPGELPLEVMTTYCPECAAKALSAIQHGSLPPHYARFQHKSVAS